MAQKALKRLVILLFLIPNSEHAVLQLLKLDGNVVLHPSNIGVLNIDGRVGLESADVVVFV